jgi:outer membrane protein
MRMCGRQDGEESQSMPKPLGRLEGVPRFAGNALLISVLVLSIPGLLCAQQTQQPSPITLQQAVNIALEKNPERKAALADTRAASADVREARSFLLPHVTFSEVATQGNDPVYVFGSKLRQQRFTTADFALNVLNTPTPFGNFATRFGGTWNLF